jgi:hypothetical protein
VTVTAVEWRGEQIPPNDDGTITLPEKVTGEMQRLHRVWVKAGRKRTILRPEALTTVPKRDLTPAMGL